MTISRRSWKTATLFSLIVFVVLLLTMLSTVSITMFLLHIGLLNDQYREITLISLAIVSIIIGMLLSKFAGRRPIKTVVEISDISKEVAKGNFDIELDENIRITELRTMAHNFNLMIKELANTEMLRKDFVENVSHEFKTPLSAIEGYAVLLQKKSLPEEKRVEYTERILLNTKRLSNLTGNILLLSRLENQGIEIKKESYSLDEQLRETILMFEAPWNQKNLDLDIDLDSADYYGNSELLAQVWQNLLSNAIKFVPNQGRIRILLRRKETALEVSIVDNGIGMSSEVLERIYEKFYQGDTSRASSGNGLGLTLAKRIVDLHGGKISVSSKEGKGTAFTVLLPITTDIPKSK